MQKLKIVFALKKLFYNLNDSNLKIRHTKGKGN